MTPVMPFGDHADDGIVQVSFSLAVPRSPAGKTAAKSIAGKMGLREAEVVHDIGLTSQTSYYIIYGKVEHAVDAASIGDDEVDYRVRSKGTIERLAAERGGPIRVVGASIGTDTHSVGIDAILNHKGYHGHPGLEAYRGFEVRNLGSQVPNEALIAEAVRMRADVILVSQTVTQQDLHVHNLTALVDVMEAEGLRDDFIVVCGGARISPQLAKELGYDAGFSKGHYAEHVASFIVSALEERSPVGLAAANGD